MSSTTQAPSDGVILSRIGNTIIGQVVQTSAFTLLYGVFLLLYLQLTAVYFKKSRLSMVQRGMFLISTITFLLATVHEATRLAYIGISIHSILIGSQDIPLAKRPLLTNILLMRPNLMLAWTGNLEVIISDSIVTWRAFVLLKHMRWLLALPLLLLLSSAASFFAYMIFITIDADAHTASRGPVLVGNLNGAGLGLSLATNFVATCLIGYVYWLHRKEMVTGLGKHQPTQAERILALLVESGFIFCLPQAVNFAIGFFPKIDGQGTAGLYVRLILNAAYYGLAAMYPTVVIVQVNNHYTLDGMYSTNSASSTNRGTDQTTLQFAVPDSETSTGIPRKQVEKKYDSIII